MAEIEITYFKGVKARGEPTRIALHASGRTWKDASLSFPEFKAAKEAGKYSSGLPVLKTASGMEYTQSLAMARYAAKLGDSGEYFSKCRVSGNIHYYVKKTCVIIRTYKLTTKTSLSTSRHNSLCRPVPQ